MTEHERARYWRENIVRLSRPQLARLIGMSESRIADIEAGEKRSVGTPIDETTMHRYRLMCAAVTLGVDFDWITCRLKPQAPVEIVIKAPEES